MLFSKILLGATAFSFVSAIPLATNLTLTARDTTISVQTLGESTDITVSAADIYNVVKYEQPQKRQAVAIAEAIISIAEDVYKLVKKIIESDKKRRQKYTQNIVARLAASDPSLNYIVVNTAYSFSGTKIASEKTYFSQTLGAKVSYDIFAFSSGTFTLNGDGGYENFAASTRCKISNLLRTYTC